jgi:DNA sulfur modification protein DndD
MIIQHLTIENLFCYAGQCKFALAPPGDERKIVLIHGRNGQGKTSFLNCVKLLFGGVTEEMRMNAIWGRNLGPKQYVVGNGTEWQGILNRRAVARGGQTYRVEAVIDEGPRRLRLNREWFLSGEDEIRVQELSGKTVKHEYKGEEARSLLFELAPSYSVPFFFFDGEVIQRLAHEDDNEKQRAIKSLLELEPVRRLLSDIERIRKSWVTDAASEEAKAELSTLEGELDTLTSTIRAHEQKVGDLEHEIGVLQEEQTELNASIKTLEDRAADEDLGVLKGQRESTRQSVGELKNKIVDRALPLAPFIICAELVEKAQARLMEKSDPARDAEIALLDQLTQRLPGQIFDTPPFSRPALTDDQKHHYKTRLTNSLRSYLPEASPRDDLQMSPKARISTRSLLAGHGSKDPTRIELVSQLHKLLEERGRLQDLEHRIDEASNLTETERTWRKDLSIKSQSLALRLGALTKEKDLIAEKLPGLKLQLAQKRVNVERARLLVEQRSKARRHFEMARNIETVLKHLIEKARESRRSTLEHNLNKHFFQLFDSNRLIKRIRLTDNFTLQYDDSMGREVMGASISAGMRQLVAVSLLWSLKEASNRRMPVIIDTPLARLDRQHQDKFITTYLPNVAEQVIILPTNSELDKRKYKALEPHVFRQYELANTAGDSVSISENAMF